MPLQTQRRRRASGRPKGRRRTTTKTRGRTRRLAKRDANGRFVKRRVRSRPRRMPARPRRVGSRPQRTRRYQRLARLGIVREASERSVAGPALVKRRWYRIDGPVDPSLPEGYALPR